MTCDDQISNTRGCHTSPEITVILTDTEKSLSYKLQSLLRDSVSQQKTKAENAQRVMTDM